MTSMSMSESDMCKSQSGNFPISIVDINVVVVQEYTSHMSEKKGDQ